MRVLVTGSHGLIASALIPRLEREGHTVTRLVRQAPGPGELQWDPDAGTLDRAGIEGHDAVVHLAGVGIGEHRWTDAHKRAVLDSRVKSTRLLCDTLAQLDHKPVLVSGSAVGFYGNRGDEELTESNAPGDDFLSLICTQWEAATGPAEEAGVRVVHLRTGIVLAKGGALKQMLTPFKLGLGGRLGTGRQWFSWVHIDDEVGAIVHALTHVEVNGGLNAVSPNPVTNADFTKALGHAVHRPTFIPVPAFGLRLLFGREMAETMMLSGQRVLPTVLQHTGYQFAHPDLAGALADIV